MFIKHVLFINLIEMKEENNKQEEANNKDKINELLMFNISKEKYQSNKISLLYLKKLDEIIKDNKKNYTNELNSIKLKYNNLLKNYYQTQIDIPFYYYESLLNTKHIYVSEKDKEILFNLRTIYYEYFDKNNINSFSIVFEFNNNCYFVPNRLEIQYLYDSKDSDMLLSVISTNIRWTSQNMNPTIKVIDSKSKSNKIEYEKVKSFFDLFQSYSEKVLLQNDELKIKCEQQGVFLKDDYIPKSLYYYLNIIPEH